MSDLRERLKNLDRRDWWLWWTATSVMVGLLAVIIILAVASALHLVDATLFADLKADIRGLAALVLLFIFYAIHQQFYIKRLRMQMLDQVVALVEMHGYAEKQRLDAVLDPLTGIYNRRLLQERLAAEVARSKRYRYPLTVAAFDLDSFKPINDQYGHAAGDLVLKHFADRLRKVTRGSDVAARTGGDEFLLILPDCRPDQVERVLGRMKDLQAAADGLTIPYDYSVGWAEYQPGESICNFLESADQMLYRHKRAHKARRAS